MECGEIMWFFEANPCTTAYVFTGATVHWREHWWGRRPVGQQRTMAQGKGGIARHVDIVVTFQTELS